MKREHVPNRWEVDTCFPVFDWLKCEFCNHEYRREKVYFRYAAMGYRLYACTNCVSSSEHYNACIDHAREVAAAKLTMKIPPPPPLRTFRGK